MIRKLLLLVMLMVSFAHPAHAKVTSYGAGETEIRLYDTTVNTVTSRWIYSDTGGVTQFQALTYQPSGAGNALSFDGIDQSVNFGTGFANFAKTDSFSYFKWVNTTDSTIQFLGGNWHPSVSAGWQISVDTGGKVRFILGNAAATARLDVKTTTTTIHDGAYHLIWVTYDGSVDVSGMQIYVDGALTSTTTVLNTDPGVLGDGDFKIARRGDDLIPYDGIIDDSGLYTGVTPLTDISDAWNSGNGLFLDKDSNFPNSGTSIGENLVALWRFDEGIGTSTADSSANTNTGTLVNSPAWVTGHILATGTDNMVTVFLIKDGTDPFQGSVFWIGHSTYPGEIRLFGDEIYFQLDGTPVAYFDRDTKTFIIDNGETTNPQLILRAAAGSSANPLEIQDSDGTILAYVDENGDSQLGHLQIGTAEAGVDYTLIFSGENNSGGITWNEGADYFVLHDDTVFSDSGAGLPYGGCWQTGGSTFNTTLTTQNVWYELDAATTNINSGELNLVTFPGDHYLQVAKAGRYFITYTTEIEINSVAGGGQHVESGIMVNGVIQGPGLEHWTFAAVSTESAFGGSAFISLSADDQISIGAVNGTSGGKILTIDHLNISILMAGG